MKYHEFTPDVASLSARILRHDSSVSDPARPADPVTVSDAASVANPPTTLAGLRALRDRTFVQSAYRVVLGRDADPSGLDQYLRQLRSGAFDKVDILGELRYSPEGEQRGVDIDGLGWRYALRRLGRRPGIGWIYRWFKALLQLPSLVEVTQRHQAEIEQTSMALEEHRSAIRTMVGELRDARRELRALSTRVQAASADVGEVFERHKELAARYQHLADANARVIQQLQDVLSGPRLPVASAQARDSTRTSTAASPDLDDWYLGFEDQFRGTREQTKRSQALYLDYVTAAGAGTVSAPVLDIGCGRGEWLELLREHGCVARGVDVNDAMVRANRDRGLDVVEQDVLAYLADQPDASIGMVTGFHVIEHLRFDLLVRLFDEARRVLKPGGCIVFETPNPENLVVGAYTFYLDPTHRHPLPPPLIEHVVRERGFADVEIVRLHPREEAGADDALLNRWFRGPTDYAVIAWKDGKGISR